VVAFDPSNRVADIPVGNLDEILGRADWVLCNEIEAATLTGATTIEASVDGARVSFGRRGVVIARALRGCLISRGREQTFIRPFEPGSSTPTALATPTVAFSSPNWRGTDELEAARRANAGAAVAIATLGPRLARP